MSKCPFSENEKFKNAYNFGVYKDDQYVFGIKGPCSFEQGMDVCKSAVDNI